MSRYCVNLKAITYESTSLNRIVADKSHSVIVAFVRCRLMGNQPWLQFQNGIWERSIEMIVLIRSEGQCVPFFENWAQGQESLYTKVVSHFSY